MLPRFLAIYSHDEAGRSRKDAVLERLAGSDPGFAIHAWDRLSVAVRGNPALPVDRGIIIGALVDRRYPEVLRSLEPKEQQDITRSGGSGLLATHWGGYVAFFDRIDGVTEIVRAPFGELPCYYSRIGPLIFFASDMEMLLLAGLPVPAICWNAVARELAWQDIRTQETCLADITALQMGHRLRIERGSVAADMLWNPWDFVTDLSGSLVEDAERIRRSTGHCISARASDHDHVLLMLSGGIDSSIVAAGLAASEHQYSLATMVTRDRHGDERRYARLMAERVDHALHEGLRDITKVDPLCQHAAWLPRPARRMFEQESARITQSHAHAIGAQTLFSGGGGDNVYCGLQSAASVTDCLLTHGPGAKMLRAASEISTVAGVSLATVLRAALVRTLPWKRDSPLTADTSYLSDRARSIAAVRPPHPWLARPRDGLPGKAAHIKALAFAQSYVDGLDPRAPVPMVAPLLGQPVVEACLAIPSWRWFEDGKNRMAARRGFALELPPEIAERRSKGTTDSFVGEIFERHQTLLCALLLDGRLAGKGLLDGPAVEAGFRAARGVAPADAARLLRLVDVEIWARAWIDRQSG